MKTCKVLKFGLSIIFTTLLTACGINGWGQDNGPIRFFVGSYGPIPEQSIFLCDLNPISGALTLLDSFAGAISPSYLDLSPDGNILYAITDDISNPEKQEMTISSFSFNRKDLSLKILNSQSSQGNGPCHVQIHPKGNTIFVANYGSGQAAAFPLDENGRIEAASSVVPGEGSGPMKNRQKSPHAHQVMTSPDGKFLLVPDLGSDRIRIYSFDDHSGTLTPNPNQPYLKLEAGSGPRHLAFHPSGLYLYLVNELNSTISALSYQSEKGILSELQTISTVEESHVGSKYPAAVRVHPNGKFVYSSTRGETSNIALYKVKENGHLSRIEVVVDIPDWPRDFNIDPTGQYLIVAGEKSNELELFRIDEKTGKLGKTGKKTRLTSPGCILFIPD